MEASGPHCEEAQEDCRDYVEPTWTIPRELCIDGRILSEHMIASAAIVCKVCSGLLRSKKKMKQPIRIMDGHIKKKIFSPQLKMQSTPVDHKLRSLPNKAPNTGCLPTMSIPWAWFLHLSQTRHCNKWPAFLVSRFQSSKWSHSTLWSFRKVIQTPGGAGGKESTCQCRRCKRHEFDPWVGKIPWSRKWQPTPVFLPGKFHGQRSLVGYSQWGCRVRHNWATEHTLI